MGEYVVLRWRLVRTLYLSASLFPLLQDFLKMSALLLLSLAVGATAQSFAPSFGACSSSGSPLRLAGTPQQGNQTLSAVGGSPFWKPSAPDV